KKLTTHASYTRPQFPKLINKSDQQLFRYERCVNKIDIDTLINSLIILDTDIALFFTRIRKNYNKEEESLCRTAAINI
ncbi:XRE family transcriptional regulator, partial [Escherichia coli]